MYVYRSYKCEEEMEKPEYRLHVTIVKQNLISEQRFETSVVSNNCSSVPFHNPENSRPSLQAHFYGNFNVSGFFRVTRVKFQEIFLLYIRLEEKVALFQEYQHG